MNKSEMIEAVRTSIERRFPGSIVVWSRDGYPEQKAGKVKQLVFEAYGIPEGNYPAFAEFIKELKRSLARPNGYSIMVHDLTMEETRKYRWQRYQEELNKRMSRLYLRAMQQIESEVEKASIKIGFEVENPRALEERIDAVLCLRYLRDRIINKEPKLNEPEHQLRCAASGNFTYSYELWLKHNEDMPALYRPEWLSEEKDRRVPDCGIETVAA